MYEFVKLLHLAAGIVWLGGMAFVLCALRPVAIAQLQPPQRLPLLSAVLARFFALVWLSIAVLLLSGAFMLAGVDMKVAPRGWHAMLGIGLLMFGIFGHIYFAPFRRLKAAVAAANWPEAGRRVAQIHPLVVLNFALGWLAVAAVLLWR
ncbi:CopD family protein [Ramlibacter sp. 2FC]|uniref:CopD family protein n=1 Tax=Ramlibacter sp. 2FC TaxID=2502188 RepID=UPI0010F708C0|nr:CopD family protein [Ramlibacter sp. 2FC]